MRIRRRLSLIQLVSIGSKFLHWMTHFVSQLNEAQLSGIQATDGSANPSSLSIESFLQFEYFFALTYYAQ